MKIILIDPPTSHEQIYGDWDLSKVDTYCPPLRLLYIASLIRKCNHIPYVIDVTAMRWSRQEAVEYALSLNPDIVGISAKTINVFNANRIAEELRERGFRGSIILGGANVSALPKETLRKFPAIDYGVIGEGEITFLELIERIEQKKSLEDVKGIVWKNDSGQILVNAYRPLIDDLDTLPLPAWDLLPKFPNGYPHSALETKRLPAASIITSRGCPYQG